MSVERHGSDLSIPEPFARTIGEVFGEAGRDWLRDLPARISACEERWSLRVLPPFGQLSYNYVAPARRSDGTEAVLKLGVPNPELATEINALRHYDGHGMVRLLDVDQEAGAFLLERLRPGTPLSREADDERATSIAADVMRRLRRPPPDEHAFPTVARWARGLQRMRERYDGGSGPIPARLADRAERLFDELIGSMDEPVLLHGDLHHFNILAAERRPWLALDPKGVVGEPAYEVGALLRNPWPTISTDPDAARILARRVDQLADELDLDRARVVGWGTAQAVLSAWWSVEDHGSGWEWGVACAEILAVLETA